MIRDDKDEKTQKKQNPGTTKSTKTTGNEAKPAPLKIKNDGYRKKNRLGQTKYIKDPSPSGSSAEMNTGAIDYDMPENTYYTKIADKIKLVKWFSIAFLILFVFGGVFLNAKELNADNLGYLLRYINIQSSNKSVKSEFYVELDEASSICYYKNNIAVLRKNRLDIYDMNGKRNFTSRLIYSAPVLKASDKYIIAYDLGMGKMEIFNSFSRVYEYKGDKPIYGAEITEKGNVVYVTSEKGYKSAVYVMNSGFSVIFRCLFEKDFVMSADIDDKAERLAVAGYYVQDGDYLSRVILYETGSQEPVKKIEVPGEQPYKVKLHDDGVYAAFENSLKFYDLSGEYISNYNFMYRKIEAISLTPVLAAVVLNEKTLGIDNRILIFDGIGDILYDNIIGSEIMDIKFSADYKFLYFLTRSGLYKIDIEQKTFGLVANEYDETTNHIVYANEKNIFLSGLLKINAIEAEAEIE